MGSPADGSRTGAPTRVERRGGGAGSGFFVCGDSSASGGAAAAAWAGRGETGEGEEGGVEGASMAATGRLMGRDASWSVGRRPGGTGSAFLATGEASAAGGEASAAGDEMRESMSEAEAPVRFHSISASNTAAERLTSDTDAKSVTAAAAA